MANNKGIKSASSVLGKEVSFLGLKGTVTICEPATDWSYYMEIEVQMGASRDIIIVTVPTDYRTDDGTPIFA